MTSATQWTARYLSTGAALVVLYAVLALPAMAATRAWVDRTQSTQDQAITLNVETDQAGAVPDWSPLAANFQLSNASSSRQVQINNGVRTTTGVFAVVLMPKRSGALEVPSLRVGNERTAPLQLQVSAPAATPASDAVAFVEVEVDERQPYVQQTVGVVLRLYFATQLASGELVLDTPEGAALQRVGEDVSGQRDVRGRRYNVVERRFLLIPERSGPLQIPAARFSGRGVGGLLDEFIGRGNGRLNATSAPLTLQVRPQPDSATPPWLPMKDLRLRYVQVPQQARVGEAVVVQVEATADGVTQAQFPELPVPSLGDAAQVFAEPAQMDETFRGSGPQLKVVRNYSIVPQRAGTLEVPGISMGWWDVGQAKARTTSLPPLTLQVAGGAAQLVPPPLAGVAGAAVPSDVALAITPAPTRPWGWMAASAAFALLWLLTLLWAWRRRLVPVATGHVRPEPIEAVGKPSVSALKRALEHGGLDEVAAALCALGNVRTLDDVAARLALPQQRAALAQLQRARWGQDGDVPAARAAMRVAFAHGPQWVEEAAVAETILLPPLYPTRRA